MVSLESQSEINCLAKALQSMNRDFSHQFLSVQLFVFRTKNWWRKVLDVGVVGRVSKGLQLVQLGRAGGLQRAADFQGRHGRFEAMSHRHFLLSQRLNARFATQRRRLRRQQGQSYLRGIFDSIKKLHFLEFFFRCRNTLCAKIQSAGNLNARKK